MKWIQKFLSEDDIQKVSDAVKKAEEKTNGEIVPVIVKRSSTVGHVPLALTLIFLLLTFFLEFPWKETLFAPPWIYFWPILGVGFFFVSAFLGRIHLVQRLLTPNFDEAVQVAHRAQLEFFLNGVNKTKGSTGILIFISVMERRAVILGDTGIAAKISNDTWQRLVDELTQKLRKGQWAKGFEDCIAECGQALATHFPAARHETNELSNQLVIKF